MKQIHRTLLLAMLVCASAATASAQHLAAAAASSSGGYDGIAGFPSGDTFASSVVADVWSHSSSRGSGPSQQASYGYAHGDTGFVPSTYMDYDQALQLGQKILAQQALPKPSFADTVRDLHLPVHPAAPTSKGYFLQQDSQGNLLACHGSADSCRPV